jgi:hypothetical protein
MDKTLDVLASEIQIGIDRFDSGHEKWDIKSMTQEKQPVPERLQKRLDIKLPLIGFYDAPDPALFGSLVEPDPGQCVFCFYKDWMAGRGLLLTKERAGCGGAMSSLFGVETRPRKEFIKFLADDEGLKASHALMEKWIDVRRAYRAENGYLVIGPLKEKAWAYAKTITFFVNPDQLSALAIGAQYRSSPDDPPPVIAPFGSGCSQLVPFQDLGIAQASIGALDIAMRRHIPPDILTFTVTRPMFKRLCELDERSFLYKPFLQRLKEARGGKL